MATGNTAPVTANEIHVTLQAQGYFQEAVAQLTQIVSQVLEANSQLTGTAMVTSAGLKFGSVVAMWCEDFEDMRSTLARMAENLGITAQRLQAGNQQGEDMAAALPQFGQGGFVSWQGSVPGTPGTPLTPVTPPIPMARAAVPATPTFG